MRISDYLNDSRRIDIKVETNAAEFALYIEYKPNAWTFATSKALEGLTGFDRVAKNLEIILKDWGLTDDEGKKIPITVEAMKENEIPQKLLLLIHNAINADIVGEKADESKND